ncbi:MAG: carbohydrate ABC transporter permease [Candidatus Bathyarchaeia archaeon]
MNRIITFVGVVLVLATIGLPIYWPLKTSLSPPEEVWEVGVPKNPTLSNYIDILSSEIPKGRMSEVVGTFTVVSPSALNPLKNSILVATVTVALTLMVSSVAAYNLARFSYRGKRFVSLFVLFAYIFPPFMLMAPLMFILSKIGALNNLVALSFVHLAYTVPFSTYMLRGYFLSIPRDLDEAAYVDGCSRLQVFLRIIMPLALPGLVTVAVFSFVMSWGDVVFSLVVLQTGENFTLPLYASSYLWGWEITDPGGLSALAVIAGMIPVILFLSIQKFVRMGILAGAVKA